MTYQKIYSILESKDDKFNKAKKSFFVNIFGDNAYYGFLAKHHKKPSPETK